MIEFSLVKLLKAQTAIANLVAARIYPDEVPAGASNFPAVVIQTISDLPVYSLTGECGLTYVRVQVSSWARRRLDARTLDDVIRQALSGYTGAADVDTIQSCLVENRRDVTMPDPDNQAAKLFGSQRDFSIGFSS